MKFLNPAGLWLLLLIPVLIIIYIIRARHEERAVSSTFIWKLSTRFMKKRLPFRKIRKVLLFTCQLLMIVAVSLLVSQPAIVAEGGGKEYVLILDGSASMNMQNEDGETRFDRATELIEELVSESAYGTPISIILASDESAYLVQRSESETEIRLALKNADCGNGDGNIEEALGLAQLICNKNAVTDVIVFSDCDYETVQNVSVVNVAEEEWNVSVSALSYTKLDGNYVFTATVCSSNKDADITLAVSADGKIYDAQSISCVADTETTATFTVEALDDFDVATVYTDAKDGLESDNSYSTCKKTVNEINVLLVSASPLYLENVLNVMGNCTVTVVSALEEATLTGYGLYIFDGCMPETLPADGSVWLFAPESAPADMSLSEELGGEAQISLKQDHKSALNLALAESLKLDEASVSSYQKLVAGRTWETLLYCGDDGVLFTRKETNGMRTVVFGFDLHDSNLPLLVDYVLLTNELLAYSVPEMLTDTDFAVPDTVSLTVLPQAELLYTELPDGEMVSLSTKTSAATVIPDTAGVYTAVQTLTNGNAQYVDFFVHIPFSEMKDEATVSTLSVELLNTDTSDAAREDGLYEIWVWVLLALLLLILAEWGLYYYEQF